MDRNEKSTALTREEFHRQLRAWHGGTEEGDEIGGGQAHARTPWIWVKHLGNRYYLHADTSHQGVSAYLELLDRCGEDSAWSVVENARGRVNKAAFGPDRVVVPGFYMYRS
jgi:hypothetical protein